MPDKAWKLRHTTWDFFQRRFYGVGLTLITDAAWGNRLRLVLNLGRHNHAWSLCREVKRQCPTKPGKPSSAG
ncbi:hypothetical protein ES707_09601 [subsurface metagenome]